MELTPVDEGKLIQITHYSFEIRHLIRSLRSMADSWTTAKAEDGTPYIVGLDTGYQACGESIQKLLKAWEHI